MSKVCHYGNNSTKNSQDLLRRLEEFIGLSQRHILLVQHLQRVTGVDIDCRHTQAGLENYL